MPLRPGGKMAYNLSVLPSDGAESVLQILKYPHPALRHPTKPLRRVDGEIKRRPHDVRPDVR